VRVSLLLAAIACLVAAVFISQSRVEGRLLRMDPIGIPENPTLMAFAASHGEAWFVARCSTCHGVDGKGDPRRGIPDLTDDDWLYGTGSISDIEQVIKYGIRSNHPKTWNLASMPAYATAHPSARDAKIPPLSPANIRDLVEFLRYRQGSGAEKLTEDRTASIGRGAALFANDGGCYDCHAADGRGDPSIGAPNLADKITLYGDGSRESLSNSISYGRAGVCPSWDSRIRSAAIRELAAYVYSMSHPRGKE
jgi:cytochrome c oxidase cbb3-type subunit III